MPRNPRLVWALAAGCVLVLGVYSGARAQDQEDLYQKAVQYEMKGSLETALAAFKILVDEYPSSPHAAEARRKIDVLGKRIAERELTRLPPLGRDNVVKKTPGRRVGTLLDAGISLPSSDEANLERLTRRLMESLGKSPTGNLPAPQPASLDVPAPVIEEVLYSPYGRVDQPLFIKIVARNSGADARQGGIAISFPDRPDYVRVFLGDDSSTQLTFYPEGSTLYSGAVGSNIRSTDPMIETYHRRSIPSQSEYALTAVLIPDKPGPLRLLVRTALRGTGKNFYNYPNGGDVDQQSYHVLQYVIAVE